jgi:serine/threonine protein kinase
LETTANTPALAKSGESTPLIFGKYEVIRRLALGGMGEVFLARQIGISFERLVILKSLLAELAEQEDFVQQFLDEASVASQLNHPNVVGILDAGLWDGTYYIAMEYIHGTDLAKLQRSAVKQGKSVPYQVSARIINDAALGLDHAHHAKMMDGTELHVVHRDISPHNIMVRQDGVTKVVDFGIAKTSNKLSRTATGMLKGKLQYMAPEQVRGESIDARADQFALGVVLWELTTNQRLFKAENELMTFEKILKGHIPRPSEVVPGYPIELENVVMRMLERNPSARYPRLADCARDLRLYLDTCSRSVGESEVASFVHEVMADELEQLTRNLPQARGQNFMLSLDSSGPNARAPGSTPATLTRAFEAQKRRSRAIAAGGSVAALLLGVTVWALFASSDDPMPQASALPATASETSPSTTTTPAKAKKKIADAARIAKRAPTKAGQGETEIDIASPVGATVIVDGKAWPEKVPTVVRGLLAGPHKVTLELDGETLDEEVVLAAAATPARLVITSSPSKATVFMGARAMGTTPLTLSELPTGTALTFSIEKRGFAATTLDVTLESGQEASRAVKLEKPTKGKSTKPVVTSTAPRSEPKERVITETVIVEKDAPTPGTFTVKTTPWAKIWIDGQAHGSTPLFKKALGAGKHTVRLVNEGAGVDVTKQITVVSGENLKHDWVLK